MGSLFGLDLTKNLSFFTVPAAFTLCLLPYVYATVLAGKLHDPANPRTLKDKLEADEKVDKITKQQIIRANNASDNGWETLGFYSAAVAAANHANVDVATLNLLTLGYVGSRIGYIFAYVVLGKNRNLAPVRSLMWMVGIGLTITLYVKAGVKLSA